METGLWQGYLGTVRRKGRDRQAEPTATAPHPYSTGCGFRSAGTLAVPGDQLDGMLRLPRRWRRVRNGGANGRKTESPVIDGAAGGVRVCVRGAKGQGGDGAESPAGDVVVPALEHSGRTRDTGRLIHSCRGAK